jgi:hypothetical protein
LLKRDLTNLGGVYGLIHVESSKQYIGSSLNLYLRLMNHIKGKDSNFRLQRAIKKYNLKNFNVVIYYFHEGPAASLREIETLIISVFPFSYLFNLKKKANSISGCPNTKQAIEKMKSRFVNRLMFGKTKSENTHKFKQISIKKPLGLYDENFNLIEKYSNQVELANKFGVHKTTISKNIKSGKLFKGKFYLRKIDNVTKKQ